MAMASHLSLLSVGLALAKSFGLTLLHRHPIGSATKACSCHCPSLHDNHEQQEEEDDDDEYDGGVVVVVVVACVNLKKTKPVDPHNSQIFYVLSPAGRGTTGSCHGICFSSFPRKLEPAMATLPNLVHYCGIAQQTLILADYYNDRDNFPLDWSSVASGCLELVPPLHNRFSHTTCHRMFICINNGIFIYFAIVDEALSRAKAFMFLEHVRDAFNIILQQRDGLSESQTRQAFNKDMGPFFHRLAAPLVGMTQKEKDLIQAEQQERQLHPFQSCESCTSSSSERNFSSLMTSTTSMAELFYDEESDMDMDPKSSSRCNQSHHTPLIGKGKTAKKKGKHQMHTNRVTDMNREGNSFEISIDEKDRHRSEECGAYQSGWESAKKLWWHNAKIIIMVDVFVCLILLAIWLVVCDGVKCLK